MSITIAAAPRPLPIRPAEPRPRRSPSLPRPPTSFVGREREAAAVRALLRPDDPAGGARLLTLTGPGGVGKTRLALHVADAVAAEFAAGVVVVPLAAVAAPDLVAPTIAQALGVREAGGRPALATLIDAIRDDNLLLLLDNLEHLLAAARLLADLLAECPRLTILATSRTPLHLAGERRFAVPPLALPAPPGADAPPSLAELRRNEAIQLFVERARAVDADFTLGPENAPAVAAVCRRLDGLPLAIELAAARSALLPPAALLARLDRRLPLLATGPRDAPHRHRTLREAITWSYDLLSPGEQALFRRLAVFAGGFTLEAAEAVGGGGQGAGDRDEGAHLPPAPRPLPPPVLDLVASLLEQSLLARLPGTDAEPRFGMLETIREFAQERLAASAEEAWCRRRHAEQMVRFVETARDRLPEPTVRAARFAAERENLRAALSWAIAAEEVRLGLRLANALFDYWTVWGQVSEAIGWFDRLLPLADNEPPGLRGPAMLGRGFLAWLAGDLDQAETLATAGVTTCEAAGDGARASYCRLLLGLVAESRGDLNLAGAWLAEALGEEEEPSPAAAAAGGHLGRVLYRRGEAERARELFERAIALSGGEARGSATALTDLGRLLADAGQVRRAAELLGECLDFYRALGDRLVVINALTAATGVVAAAGRLAAAVELAAAAEAMRTTVGTSLWAIASVEHERTVGRAQRQLDPSAFAAAWQAGAGLTLDDALACAGATLAAIAAAPGGDPAPSVVPSPATPADSPLSARELEVLRLIAAGCTDQEVGVRLGLRHRTVTSYVASIRRKLDVPSRAAAVAAAGRRGLL